MIQVKRSEIYQYFHDNAENLIGSYFTEDNKTAHHHPTDKKKWSYVCPKCGSGSHRPKEGDGITYYKTKTGTPGYYSCHVCGSNGDLVDWIGIEQNLPDTKEGREEMLKRACDIYGIELINDYDNSDPVKRAQFLERQAKQKEQEQKKREQAEKSKNELISKLSGKDLTYKKLIDKAISNIKNPESLKYLQERGISLDTAKYFMIGHARNQFVGNRTFKSCMIIPSTYASFQARDTDPNVSGNDKVRKPAGGSDMPVGLMQIIERAKDKAFRESTAPIWIVEGPWDAMSIYEIGHHDVIALNGLGNKETISTALKEYGMSDKRLIIALDNDEAGKGEAPNIQKFFKDKGFKAVSLNIVPESMKVKDANEFLVKNRELLKKTIETAENPKLFQAKKGLVRNRLPSFIERRNNPLEPIPTGFPILDSDEYLGRLPRDLVVIAGHTSTGKTAFCTQIAEYLASDHDYKTQRPKKAYDVLYVSLEMSADEIMARGISRFSARDFIESGRPTTLSKTSKGVLNYDCRTFEERTHLEKSTDLYIESISDHLNILEAETQIGMDEIEKIVATYYEDSKSRIPPGSNERPEAPVIILDYIQLLRSPDPSRNLTDKQQVDINTLRAKMLAKKYSTCVICISSINRSSYNTVISLGSLKESGSLEYTSHAVLALQPAYIGKSAEEQIAARAEEKLTGIRNIQINILKNRSGVANTELLYEFTGKFSYFKEIGEVDSQLQKNQTNDTDTLDDPDFTPYKDPAELFSMK